MKVCYFDILNSSI